MSRLTDADIQKYLDMQTCEGPWQNREWLAALLDLKEVRQDLRDLYLLSSGDTSIALGAFRERLEQKYGWEGEA